MEIWKTIENYPNYEVSNTGQVRSWVNKASKRRKSPKLLKPSLCANGYLAVTLYADKSTRPKRFNIHRLVLQAFVANIDNLPQINHKDENRQNNHVDNLEWCDSTCNLKYSNVHKKGLATKQNKNKSNAEKPICAFNKENVLIMTFKSLSEAERAGYHRYGIRQVINGKTKTHKGYIWKFKKENI